MIDAGSLEYAHARISARYGARADELGWRRLAMIRDLGAFLDAARTCALGAWVTAIGPDSDVHAIERALRAHWRERLAAIAAWMPPDWRAAIEWYGLWPALPVLQHLARGGTAPAWWRDDPLAAALREGQPASRDAGAAMLLAAGKAAPERMGSLWHDAWLRRLPEPGKAPSLLAEFAGVMKAHAIQFCDPLQADGWAVRRALHARLAQLFRRATLDPAAAFIFLTLSALEGERLRGELVRRAVFPNVQLAS